MDILEREHIKLKDEHTQFKKLYFDQSEEITTLKQKNIEEKEENLKLKMELEKAKKSANKGNKDHETKMKEMNEEMQKAYNEVD